ncbi:MAG: minor capsid protein [Oscillospiraceae bacterium]|nr:minor capsid protein [Oscillospiraceae bacterium]
MSATFKFNVPEIMGNIEAANKEALAEMSKQILADSNRYCKLDQGTLIASALNSDLESGAISWDTPYAGRQYYLENTHTDKNPNAQMMWFHKAKDIHADEWERVCQNAFKKAMKGDG